MNRRVRNSLLAIFFCGFGLANALSNASPAGTVLLSIAELRWRPALKATRIEILKDKRSGEPVFRLVSNEETVAPEIKEIPVWKYEVARNALYRSMLKQEARGTAFLGKCQPAIKIVLSDPPEKAVVCAGDFVTYFEVKGIISRLMN